MTLAPHGPGPKYCMIFVADETRSGLGQTASTSDAAIVSLWCLTHVFKRCVSLVVCIKIYYLPSYDREIFINSNGPTYFTIWAPHTLDSCAEVLELRVLFVHMKTNSNFY